MRDSKAASFVRSRAARAARRFRGECLLSARRAGHKKRKALEDFVQHARLVFFVATALLAQGEHTEVGQGWHHPNLGDT